MKYLLILGGLGAALMYGAGGDAPSVARSILHGFEWGLGREVAHSIVHHVLH